MDHDATARATRSTLARSIPELAILHDADKGAARPPPPPPRRHAGGRRYRQRRHSPEDAKPPSRTLVALLK